MKPTTFEVIDPKTGEKKKCVALIRKLTEAECFKLMGVEEPDIAKIQASGVSRSAMYKMAGNSIVVDVLYHIFRKMFIEPENEINESAEGACYTQYDTAVHSFGLQEVCKK